VSDYGARSYLSARDYYHSGRGRTLELKRGAPSRCCSTGRKETSSSRSTESLRWALRSLLVGIPKDSLVGQDDPRRLDRGRRGSVEFLERTFEDAGTHVAREDPRGEARARGRPRYRRVAVELPAPKPPRRESCRRERSPGCPSPRKRSLRTACPSSLTRIEPLRRHDAALRAAGEPSPS